MNASDVCSRVMNFRMLATVEMQPGMGEENA